jgi:hypothetical protein
MFTPSAVQAHPPCADIDAVEEWVDTRSDAGQKLLDDEHEYREAFRLLSSAADALNDCMPEIVETHYERGVAAGNTDPSGLRDMLLDTNYGMVATKYESAADAAVKLHDRTGCREMLTLANGAWRKRADTSRSILLKNCAAVSETRRCGPAPESCVEPEPSVVARMQLANEARPVAVTGRAASPECHRRRHNDGNTGRARRVAAVPENLRCLTQRENAKLRGRLAPC